jgi:hypothetical protein
MTPTSKVALSFDAAAGKEPSMVFFVMNGSLFAAKIQVD